MYEQENGDVVVSFMDPATVLALAESADAQRGGSIAKEKLLRVIVKLSA